MVRMVSILRCLMKKTYNILIKDFQILKIEISTTIEIYLLKYLESKVQLPKLSKIKIILFIKV